MWCRFNPRVAFLPVEDIKVLFERGSPAPLELTVDVEFDTPLFDLVRDHIGRLKTLRNIMFDAFEDPMAVTPSFPEPILSAPLLEDFGVVSYEASGIVIPLLPVIRDAPRLRSLSMQRARLFWASDTYHNMAHLSITDVPSTNRSASDGQILDLFQNCPNLESLELHLLDKWTDVLPGYVHAPRPGENVQRIQTPNLRTLKLNMRPELLLFILRRIVLSPLFQRLEVASVYRDPQHLDELLSEAHLPAFFFTNLRKLKIEQVAMERRTIVLFGKGHGAGGEYALRVETRFEYEDEDEDMIHPASAMHSMIPKRYALPALTVLKLSEEETRSAELSASHIAALLGRLPTLVSLSLNGYGFPSSFAYFHPAIADDQVVWPPPLPHLRRLTICQNGPYLLEIDSYAGNDAYVEDMPNVLDFVRPFAPHLVELRILLHDLLTRDPELSHGSMGGFVRAVRDLGVPNVWWREDITLGGGAIFHVQEFWQQEFGSEHGGLCTPHFLSLLPPTR